jgi:hypothetical protein
MPSRSRSAELLARLLEEGWTTDRLAEEMVVPVAVVDSFVDGSVPMPMERQLCVALFAIQHSEAHRREGWALHGQIEATMRFERRAIGDIPEESTETTSSAFTGLTAARSSCIDAVRRARELLAESRELRAESARVVPIREEVQRYSRALKHQGRTAESVVIEMKRVCAEAIPEPERVANRRVMQQIVSWSIDAYYHNATG